MTPTSASTIYEPSSYEKVGRRIQQIVSDPKVQKYQAANVSRREEESPEAWDRVLRELDETDGITVERLEPGCVRIGWKRYIDI
jgi:hypothetical protein